jgi:hypothetical protein
VGVSEEEGRKLVSQNRARRHFRAKSALSKYFAFVIQQRVWSVKIVHDATFECELSLPHFIVHPEANKLFSVSENRCAPAVPLPLSKIPLITITIRESHGSVSLREAILVDEPAEERSVGPLDLRLRSFQKPSELEVGLDAAMKEACCGNEYDSELE